MQKLVNGALVDLTPEEISQREADAIKTQEEQATQTIKDQIDTNLKYLSYTDWYVVRFAETSVAIPTEVATIRAEARVAIDNLKAQL